MAVQDVFYAVCAANAPLKALVAYRVSPLKLNQNTALPAVTYQRVAGVPEHAMGADPDIITSLLQVDCWGDGTFGAEGYGSAMQVAEAVKDAWSRYSQAETPGSPSGTQIDDVFLEDEQDFWEESVGMFRLMLEFRVFHRT